MMPPSRALALERARSSRLERELALERARLAKAGELVAAIPAGSPAELRQLLELRAVLEGSS